MKQEVFVTTGTVIKTTEKAMLIRLTHVDDIEIPETKVKPEWYPRSQITDQKEPEMPGDPYRFNMKRWILEGKGLV
jgi:hypothetical protein